MANPTQNMVRRSYTKVAREATRSSQPKTKDVPN